MNLRQWAENGWLKPHKTSFIEISNLLKIVDRDLVDASGILSDDWRFGIAYNAALKLCTILLYAEGYKPERNLGHYRAIHALSIILGENRKKDVSYLDTCRNMRNIVEYDYVGAVTDENAAELIEFVKELKRDVLGWLKQNHPELIIS